jgi:hypothetical protein
MNIIVCLSGSGTCSSRLGGTFLFPARGHVPHPSASSPAPKMQVNVHIFTGSSKSWPKGIPSPARLPPGRASQDGKHEDPGLAEGWKGVPGPKSRGSGPGRGLERRPRTEKPGIRAWQRAGKAPQDRKAGDPGLAGGWKGVPGPEMRRLGLGWGPEGRARTGIAAIWAWVGAKKPGQDQNHRKLGLADTGCDRNNSDLQNAGTLIQLPGLYRAYERERSVKIFTFFSLRSAS